MAPLENPSLIPIAKSTMNVVEASEGDVVLFGHNHLWDALMWRPRIRALFDGGER